MLRVIFTNKLLYLYSLTKYKLPIPRQTEAIINVSFVMMLRASSCDNILYHPFIEFIEVNSEKRYLYWYFPYRYLLVDKFEKKLSAKRYRPFIGFRRSLMQICLLFVYQTMIACFAPLLCCWIYLVSSFYSYPDSSPSLTLYILTLVHTASKIKKAWKNWRRPQSNPRPLGP